jgi:hypothetical protein
MEENPEQHPDLLVTQTFLKALYGKHFYVPGFSQQLMQLPEVPSANSVNSIPRVAAAVLPQNQPKTVGLPTPQNAIPVAITTKGTQPAKDTTRVEFKEKPLARLTVFLCEAEYSNRQLTELLKKIIEALELPLQVVAFGKVKAQLLPEDFEAMPTRYGLLFGAEWLAQPLPSFSNKQVFVVNSLQVLSQNVSAKREAWEVMKSFKDDLL